MTSTSNDAPARLQALLLEMRTTGTQLPPSGEHIRRLLNDARRLLIEQPATASEEPMSDEIAAASNAVAVPAAPASPSPLLQSFCSSGGGYATLTSWLWRRDVVSEFARSCMDNADALFLSWFEEPFPATEAFLALVAATRTISGWSSSTPAATTDGGRTVAAVHALLRTVLLRFLEVQPRIGALLAEVCDEEERRAAAKSSRMLAPQRQQERAAVESTAAARAQIEHEVKRAESVAAKHGVSSSASSAAVPVLPLSPSSTLLLDQLCSFPDVLANALRGDLPYSLSQRSWHAGVVAQAQQLIAVVSSVDSSSAARKPASYLAPLASLIAKLVRLGQSELVLDAFLEPVVLQLQQQFEATKSAEIFVNALPPMVSYSAYVFQSVGVQSMEKLLEHTLVWLAMRFASAQIQAHEAAMTNEEEKAASDTAAVSTPLERAILSVFPSLFPLSFYQSQPLFSLLVSNRFFLAKTSLPPLAIRILVNYLWRLSLQQHAAHPAKRLIETHQTLLDQVLLTLLQAWCGGSGGGGSGDNNRAAQSMSAEAQLHLGKAILATMQQMEQGDAQWPPKHTATKKKETDEEKKGKKNEAEKDEHSFTSLGSFASSPCVSLLLSGVHSRMSSPLIAVRKNAMQIAKIFSRMMGGTENEIDFEGEEMEEHEAQEEKNALMHTQQMEAATGNSKATSSSSPTKQKGSIVTLTPASMINSQHLNSTATAAAPLPPPLQPHSLADDERDLRKVALPYFLRDALDILHKKQEDLDSMEAALESLPALIARHPADLPLLSRDLMAALVNIGSNVFVESNPKLAHNRRKAMLNLCSTLPANAAASAEQCVSLSASVSYLVREFWGSNYSLGTKMEILDVLRDAAEKLAGMDQESLAKLHNKKLIQQHQQQQQNAKGAASPKQPLVAEVSSSASAGAGRSLVPLNTPSYASASSTSTPAVSATLAQHQAIVAARVEARTRRWGDTKRAAAEGKQGSSGASNTTYSINRFAPVAHLFFFPLLRGLESPVNASVLAQHDGLLLLRLLHTLSAMLPCSSGLTQALPVVTRNMAKALLEFLLLAGAGAGAGATGAHAGAASSSSSSSAPSAQQQVGLRRMLFFCLSRILVCYNELLFGLDFPSEIPELVAWLTEAAVRDADQECRQLAHANFCLLKELIGNAHTLLFKQEANTASHRATIAQAALPALKF